MEDDRQIDVRDRRLVVLRSPEQHQRFLTARKWVFDVEFWPLPEVAAS